MSHNAEKLIIKLMEYYSINTISELSKILGIGQPAISKWKINNSINPIKKICRELGIYNDIFGDIQNDKTVSSRNSLKEAPATPSSDSIINKEILDLISAKATKYGMNAKEYINAILLEDLRKEGKGN